jgi:hypothetical protein
MVPVGVEACDCGREQASMASTNTIIAERLGFQVE